MIGHFSSRYKELAPLLDEARTLFPASDLAEEGAHLHDRKTTFQMLTKADIRLVRSLADKRARTDEGLFVAEGGKLIGELRASTLRIRRIYALDGVFAGEDVTTVSPKEMERLSLLKTPSDSLALVEIPAADSIPQSCAGRWCWRSTTCRTRAIWGRSSGWPTGSASATWFAPRRRPTVSTPKSYRPRWARSCACGSTTATSKPIWRPSAPPARRSTARFWKGTTSTARSSPTGIVLMGNEGRGVTPACAAQVTRKLFIPPYPAERHATESLNVAMATGIVCAEFRRQASAGR